MLLLVLLLGLTAHESAGTPAAAVASRGGWSGTTAMAGARVYQTALTLPDGTVLVAGGVDPRGVVLASAELYNPRTGRWAATAPMGTGRAGVTAILLPNHRVLVAGGAGGTAGPGPVLRSSELYDPHLGRWARTGEMAAGRFDYAATLLADGRVLVAGGADAAGGTLATAEVYDPTTGRWAATGRMLTARAGHTATLLPTGLVLVAGGASGAFGSGPVVRSAELYDPRTGRWRATGALGVARAEHTATVLAGGEVLVAGGEDGQPDAGGVLAGAELYNPRTGRWSATGSMVQSRYNHTATRLPDGRVLVAGGQEESVAGHAVGSAELYDPRLGAWTVTSGMGTPRTGHTATLLPNGTVLVTGGSTQTAFGPTQASAEIYDPRAAPTGAVAGTSIARALCTATLLPDGAVLVAGGIYAPPSRLARSTAELYSPRGGTWRPAGSMTEARAGQTATLLPDGRVLVAGGFNSTGVLAGAELYDARTGTWTATGPMHSARAYHTATLLANGSVLVAGGLGRSGGTLAVAEVYTPHTGRWQSTGSMVAARSSQTATLLGNGRVLVAGGVTGRSDRVLASAELYDPRSRRWAATGGMAGRRAGHTATLLPNGQVLVAGGQQGLTPGTALATAETYDPHTGAWTRAGRMAQARVKHTATLLPNGTVLVAGGEDQPGAIFNSAEIYSPRTRAWRAAQGMNAAQSYHVAALLPNGTVLVAGGVVASYFVLSLSETFDPRTGRWTTTGSM